MYLSQEPHTQNRRMGHPLLLTVEKAVNKMISEGKTYKKSAAA